MEYGMEQKSLYDGRTRWKKYEIAVLGSKF